MVKIKKLQENFTMDEGNVLDIKNLSISFGGLKAVDNLSFVIKEKEIFGLIGPNGAGKTTVFNCITQFYKPDTGTILMRNKDSNVVNLIGVKVHNVIRQGIVRTFQNVELIHELSVIDNLLIGSHIYYKTDLLSQMLRLPKANKEESKFREKAVEILRFVGIEAYKDVLVAGLPYGVLKKVELARTLMSDPKIIILDEPAAGLNDQETDNLSILIKKIRNQFNCAIFLVEHDMRLVMGTCDRICAISFGKLLAVGDAKEIQRNKLVQEAYLGKEDDEDE